MRFFRTSDPALYESVRSQLDSAWGHPTADGTTRTCIDPAVEAPRDSAGRILLAVNDEFATWPPASELLPQFLESGVVEEIAESEYQPVPRV
jgi:hypothetical protein